MHLCSSVQNPLQKPSQSKHKYCYNIHRYICIYTYVYTCVYVCICKEFQAKQIERLINTKISPIDLCTGKLKQWMAPRTAQHGALLHFQCKRQPKRLPANWKVGYVGISVVVSHKYARTQTSTHTNTYKPWSAASGRSRGSIRWVCMSAQSLYAHWVYICVYHFLCAPWQFKNAYFKNKTNNNKLHNSHHQNRSKRRQATTSDEVNKNRANSAEAANERGERSFPYARVYSFTVRQ